MKVKKDILHLIEKDHQVLFDSIKVLTEEEFSTTEKKRQLDRFLFNLKVHKETEEAALYESLVALKDLRPLVLESYEEHNIADHLVAELQAMNFMKHEWDDEVEAKAKVLAELIFHHAREEENELFPVIQATLTRQELNTLGAVYLQRRKEFKDRFDREFVLPSVDQISLLVQKRLKSAVNQVSNFVSARINFPE